MPESAKRSSVSSGTRRSSKPAADTSLADSSAASVASRPQQDGASSPASSLPSVHSRTTAGTKSTALSLGILPSPTPDSTLSPGPSRTSKRPTITDTRTTTPYTKTAAMASSPTTGKDTAAASSKLPVSGKPKTVTMSPAPPAELPSTSAGTGKQQQQQQVKGGRSSSRSKAGTPGDSSLFTATSQPQMVSRSGKQVALRSGAYTPGTHSYKSIPKTPDCASPVSVASPAATPVPEKKKSSRKTSGPVPHTVSVRSTQRRPVEDIRSVGELRSLSGHEPYVIHERADENEAEMARVEEATNEDKVSDTPPKRRRSSAASATETKRKKREQNEAKALYEPVKVADDAEPHDPGGISREARCLFIGLGVTVALTLTVVAAVVFMDKTPAEASLAMANRASTTTPQPLAETLTCDNNPCLNNGTCIPVVYTVSGYTLTCVCTRQFSGKLCELELGPTTEPATTDTATSRVQPTVIGSDGHASDVTIEMNQISETTMVTQDSKADLTVQGNTYYWTSASTTDYSDFNYSTLHFSFK